MGVNTEGLCPRPLFIPKEAQPTTVKGAVSLRNYKIAFVPSTDL